MPTDMERQLAEKDRQLAELTEQVSKLTAELGRARLGGGYGSRGALSARPSSARRASPGRRPMSATTPGRVPGGGATARPSSPPRRAASGQPHFFHASMRGGPLTEPLAQRGLTERERANPYKNLQGPSLLDRRRFGAKKSPWENFKANPAGEPAAYVSALDDDNPFNDPIKYWPFKGWAYPPSDYTGPDDARETDDLSKMPSLALQFVYGYAGRRVRQNLFYNADKKVVYHTAALGVVYDKDRHEQLFFLGHDDDVTALDLHPNGVTVCSGQVGKDPKILVWSSRPDAQGVLQQLCVIQGDHKRAIAGLSFSATGQYIASMGKDNNRSIALYKWSTNPAKHAAEMRIGMDKGHNDDIFCLDFNPATDHVVGVGKKYIRFFGVKEGVEEKASESRDAKLSKHESALWAKKGVFGKRGKQQDMMCVAFGNDGITYAGTADGHIYRFAEQTMDLAVAAHDNGKVTALWFNPKREVLISSGDDGFLKMWDPSRWSSSREAPLKAIDLNKWVSPDLMGPPVKLDSYDLKEGDHDWKRHGSPAAAHSLHGDESGKVLVGTVCNEIYEVDFDAADEAPMCYMQGHYDELWGLAEHPLKQEFVTTSNDATLRVWDVSTRTQKYMAKLQGPGRCCAYSPDGKFIAVGLGSGGKASGRPLPHEGKWLILDEELNQVESPPQVRKQRVADIKFSPDGTLIAVGSADNFIDIYAFQGGRAERRCELKGHSSYITHLDWSADSTALMSCCGAYELLYWKMFTAGGAFKPHQEKTGSKMKDAEWATSSCIFGWGMRGIWPEDSDGTDVNATARSHGAKSYAADAPAGLLATADDFGKVKVFRWPCVVPRAVNQTYLGHSSHVTNVAFSADDELLVSTGGNDRAVFQWKVLKR